MLVVFLGKPEKTGEKPEKREVIWHMGDKFPLTQLDASSACQVNADGHELEFILSRFSNLPRAQSRIVCWFGDHAKFIAVNLGLVQTLPYEA